MKLDRSIVTHSLAALLAAAAVVAAGAGRSAEVLTQPEGMDPAAMQAAMDNWLKTTQPNEKHKYLEQFAGEWDTTMRLFFGPGAPASESRGTSSMKLIHGGRFLKQESTGTMKLPKPDGTMMETPMNGLGLTGYDNNRKLYTIAWTDSMSTGILTGTGSLSPDGSTMTVFGTMDELMTGEMGKTVKYVTRIVSPDKHVFEIHEVLYGEPFKVVEIEYNRKK